MDFKSLVLFVWLSATITVVAQTDFAPLGTYWNYDYTSHSGDYKTHETLMVTSDTIINGYPVKFLTKNVDVYYAFPPNNHGTFSAPFGALQVEGDSIFYYLNYPFNKTFLFSFSMQEGDTVRTHGLFIPFIAIVDSSFNTVINGDTLQQWILDKYCDDNYWYSINVIELIGQIDDYLFWNEDGCLIGGGTWDFQCFSSPTIKYNEPCEPIIVGIEPAAEDQTFKLFPNPADDQLRIISPVAFKEVIIYNQLGQQLKTFNFPLSKQTVINLHELASGLYVVLIEAGEITRSDCFVIQR